MASTSRSTDEKLPPEMRNLFSQLWQQVASLHFSWGALTQLFNGDPQRIHVLRETAPNFFALVRHALQDSVVLAISRLTDPAIQGRFQNASLAALVDTVRPLAVAEFHSSLARELDALVTAAEPVRARRNRVVAHLDSATILSSDPEPLPGVSRDQFERVLSEIRSLMNRVEAHFADATTAFDRPISHGDADHLVFYLEQALKAENEERQKHGLPPR